MVSDFPQFHPLSRSDSVSWTTLVERRYPYSEVNFKALWSATHGAAEASRFSSDGLLVSASYENGTRGFYLLTPDKPDFATIGWLERHRQAKSSVLILPALYSRSDWLSTLGFTDRDNYDYIYATENLSTFSGPALRRKRYYADLFVDKCRPEVRPFDLHDSATMSDITALYEVWVRNGGLSKLFSPKRNILR